MNPEDALRDALASNDAAAVARVLEHHADLRARLDDPLPGGAFGETALIAAARHANREMVDVLLRAGADINQKSHWWAGPFGVMDDAWREPWLASGHSQVDAAVAERLAALKGIPVARILNHASDRKRRPRLRHVSPFLERCSRSGDRRGSLRGAQGLSLPSAGDRGPGAQASLSSPPACVMTTRPVREVRTAAQHLEWNAECRADFVTS
jgi:hypothetical protein